MNPVPLPPDPVRFGEGFELDLKARQLLRFGQVVKLERIPLEVLILLVEKHGAIVDREEIVAKVWGGSFLDTDNAINGSIRKIRQVLKTIRKSLSTFRRSPARDIGLSPTFAR